MRLALLVALVIPGLVLLATPLLPLGLLMLWAGWWVYERSSLPNSDALITLLQLMAGAGALAIFVQFAVQRVTALL